MKTKQLIFSAVLMVLTTFTSQAQFKAGAGIHYATDINSIGISVNAAYEFNDTWGAMGAFTYFPEKDYVKWSAVDFNGRYNFSQLGDNGVFYAIGGINITTVKVEIDGYSIDYDYGDYYSDYYSSEMSSGSTSASSSDVGLNIGVGMELGLSDKISLAPEAIYTISSGGYLRLGTKVMYSF
jgi:hypothetical protein